MLLQGSQVLMSQKEGTTHGQQCPSPYLRYQYMVKGAMLRQLLHQSSTDRHL